MKLILLCMCLLFAFAVCDNPGSLSWPKQYTVTGVERYDDMGVKEPITVYYDGEAGKMRKERYGGNDTTINMGYEGCHKCWANYDPICYMMQLGPPSGPLMDFPEQYYTGQVHVRGIPCYRYAFQSGPRLIEFFVDFSMNPVRSTFLNSTQIVDFYTYKVGAPASSLFQCPSDCQNDGNGQLNEKIAERKSISSIEAAVENLRFVAEHNSNPKRNYTLGMNSLSHLTDEEFAQKRMPKGLFKKRIQSKIEHTYSGNDLPSYINWIEKGAIHAVKDQADCGSCWSFATAESIEAYYYLKYGKSLTLSEQSLMDCSWNYDNHGCDGGVTQKAYQFIIDQNGIYAEDDYHYDMANLRCRDRSIYHPKAAKISSFTNVKSRDEHALMEAVSKGPVAIAINASPRSFQLYTSGVYTDSSCTGGEYDLDHAVLLVGYGTDSDTGLDYWLIQNSWGVMWGDKGLIKMARENNICGVQTDPTYPTVV